MFIAKSTYIKNTEDDPRWQLEGGRRQCELCKSKILLRCWSYTWQKKASKKQNSNTLNPQPVQSFFTPPHTEKTGGLLHLQTPAPKLLGRRRPTR
jgi:hypothetical protein